MTAAAMAAANMPNVPGSGTLTISPATAATLDAATMAIDVINVFILQSPFLVYARIYKQIICHKGIVVSNQGIRYLGKSGCFKTVKKSDSFTGLFWGVTGFSAIFRGLWYLLPGFLPILYRDRNIPFSRRAHRSSASPSGIGRPRTPLAGELRR